MGHLNFACQVVVPGRAFLWWLCNAMNGLQKPLHRTRIMKGMRQDMLVCINFLDGFNGVSFWTADISLGADF